MTTIIKINGAGEQLEPYHYQWNAGHGFRPMPGKGESDEVRVIDIRALAPNNGAGAAVALVAGAGGNDKQHGR